MNAAKPNCLLAVQNEHGLSLDKSLPFHDYINAAVLIAHKVQTNHVAEAEPAAAKTWAQTAATDARPKKRGAATSADGSNRMHCQNEPSMVPFMIPSMVLVTMNTIKNFSGALSDERAAMLDATATAVDDFSPATPKAKAAERLDATFNESLGRCPLCGFVSKKGMTLKGHDCYLDKNAQRVEAARADCLADIQPNKFRT